MDYVWLGKFIRDRRQSFKMTQAALAKQTHTSVAYISHIERGVRKVNLETLIALAQTLRFSLDELFCIQMGKKEFALLSPEDIDRAKKLLRMALSMCGR